MNKFCLMNKRWISLERLPWVTGPCFLKYNCHLIPWNDNFWGMATEKYCVSSTFKYPKRQFVFPHKILQRFSFHFLKGRLLAPREIENNPSAKFGGENKLNYGERESRRSSATASVKSVAIMRVNSYSVFLEDYRALSICKKRKKETVVLIEVVSKSIARNIRGITFPLFCLFFVCRNNEISQDHLLSLQWQQLNVPDWKEGSHVYSTGVREKSTSGTVSFVGISH